jgi:hypothetical protein
MRQFPNSTATTAIDSRRRILAELASRSPDRQRAWGTHGALLGGLLGEVMDCEFDSDNGASQA